MKDKMAVPYGDINGTLLSNDIMYLFIYANNVTHNWFVIAMVVSFFLLIFISSLALQQRYTGRIRFETSFAAACFALLGFATLIEQRTGLLSPLVFMIIIVMTIISVIALFLSQD